MKRQTTLSPTNKGKPGFFYGYIIVLAGFFVMMLIVGTHFSFGVFFKPVLDEFGWSRTALSGAYSLSLLMFGVGSIVMGKLSDKFGPRIAITICGCLLGIPYLLMSQINAMWQLYLLFGALAGASVGVFTPLLSTVAKWFVKRRGAMSGIVVSGTGVGLLIMPLLFSWLISSYGWRTSYVIIGSIVLVLVILAAQFFKRDPSKIGRLPDDANEMKAESVDSGIKGYSFSEAIRTGQFWMVNIIYAFFIFSEQLILVHLVPHATDIGILAVSAAGILSFVGGMNVAGRLGIGGISDKIGNKLAFITVLAVMTISLFWLQYAQELWMFYLFAVLFGFSNGGGIALSSPLVAELFGLKNLGTLLGVVSFAQAIGGSIGPFVAGYIYDTEGSYHSAFLIAAILSVAALIIALRLKPTRREGLG